MSSLGTAFFCEPEALQTLTQLFAKSLGVKTEELRILEFLRYAAASPGRIRATLLVLRGLSPFIASAYTEPRMAINLLREGLRKIGRETTLLIEAKKVSWSPTSRSDVVLDGIRLPVSSIEVEDTLRLQGEYGIKAFVKARL
jgi:hypothetical protein